MEPVYIDLQLRQNVDTEAKKATDAVTKLESDSIESSRRAERELKQSIALQKQHLARLKADMARIKAELQRGDNWNTTPLKKSFERLQDELIDETEGLRHLQAELELTSRAKETLANKIYRVKDAMGQLRAAGESNSAEYGQLRNELEHLNEAYQAVSTEQRLMTKDAGDLEGIISGLQGMNGAIDSVVGAVGLVNNESEKYQRIQTKVQSLIAITIGLQQVQQAVSETSAFRLRILTGATTLYSRAVKGLSVAMNISEVAAKRMMAALTLGLSIVITWAVSAIDKFISKQKKAAEEQKAYREAVSDTYSRQVSKFEELRRAYQALEGDEKKRQQFVEEHKKAFDELGVAISNTLEADNLFIDNAEAFRTSLRLRAEAVASFDMAVEKYKTALQKEMEAEERSANPTFGDKTLSVLASFDTSLADQSITTSRAYAARAAEDLRKEAEEARKEGDKLIGIVSDKQKEANDTLSQAHIAENNEEKRRADEALRKQDEARRKQAEARKAWLQERKRAEETLSKYSREAENEATAIEIASIKNAREKKLRELKEEYDKRKALIATRLKEIASLEATYHIDGSNEKGKLNTLSSALDTQYAANVEAQKEASRTILRETEAEVAARGQSRLDEQLASIDAYYAQVEEKARAHAANEDELQALLAKADEAQLKERELAVAESELRRLDLEERITLRGLEMQRDGYSLQTDADEAYLEAKLTLVRKRLDKLREIEAHGGDATDAIRDATQEVEELTTELNAIPAKRITEIGKGLQGIFSSLSGIGGSLGEVFNSASAAIGNILSSIKGGATTMDLLGNAVAGIMQVVSMAAEQSRKNAEAERKYAASVAESYHRMALARIQAYEAGDDNIFGVEDPYKRAVAGAQRYRQAMLELHDMMERLGNGRVQTGTQQVTSGKNISKGALGGAAAGVAIGTILPGIGTIVGGVIGALVGAFAGTAAKETVPVFQSLTEQYGSILKEGSKTFELNPKILADYDKLDDATKKLVDNWEEIRKEALAAQKEMRETFKRLAGDIGDLLGKALADAFRTGEWEAEMNNFERKLDAMIGRIVDQLIFSAIFGEEFRKLQKAMEDSFGEGGDQSIVDDIINFKKKYREMLEQYKKAKADADRELKEQGVDPMADEEERQSVSKRGLAQASQDSINELMGIATNQLLQLRTLVEMQRNPSPIDLYRNALLSRIARDVASISVYARYLDRLDRLAVDLNTIKRDGLTVKN